MTFIFNQKRFVSLALSFKKSNGSLDVLRFSKYELPRPEKGHLTLKILASPINPSDINQVQGVYPLNPYYCKKMDQYIGGNEFVGKVVEVGEGVDKKVIGSLALGKIGGLGSWRTYMNVDKSNLFFIPKTKMDILELATLSVNPATAYRMLKDYVDLQKDKESVVIQNGANSAVGQAVIQLCKEWDIKTINIIRNRENYDELKQELLNLNATYVFKEEEVKSYKFQQFISQNKFKIKLGLNCVGGENATNIIRNLDKDSMFVTYGGMSKKPIQLSTSALIFKNITFIGFWLSQWKEKNRNNDTLTDKMYEELIHLFEQKIMIPPKFEKINFPTTDEPNSHKNILDEMMSQKEGLKKIFVMNDIE